MENHCQTNWILSLFIENVLLENKKLINYLIENKEKNIEYFEQIYNQYKNKKKNFKHMTLIQSMAMSWIMYIYH